MDRPEYAMPLQVRSCTRLKWFKPILSAGNAVSIFVCRDPLLVVKWPDNRVLDHAFLPFATTQDQHEYHTSALTAEKIKLIVAFLVCYHLIVVYQAE